MVWLFPAFIDTIDTLWNAPYWKTLSVISETAGKLDLALVWEDELDDLMGFFACGFLSCFPCLWLSYLPLFFSFFFF